MSTKQNIQNQTGLYKLGFNKWSFLGIALPVGFVAVIGGLFALMVM